VPWQWRHLIPVVEAEHIIDAQSGSAQSKFLLIGMAAREATYDHALVAKVADESAGTGTGLGAQVRAQRSKRVRIAMHRLPGGQHCLVEERVVAIYE
jgi:hypothetical protein